MHNSLLKRPFKELTDATHINFIKNEQRTFFSCGFSSVLMLVVILFAAITRSSLFSSPLSSIHVPYTFLSAFLSSC